MISNTQWKKSLVTKCVIIFYESKEKATRRPHIETAQIMHAAPLYLCIHCRERPLSWLNKLPQRMIDLISSAELPPNQSECDRNSADIAVQSAFLAESRWPYHSPFPFLISPQMIPRKYFLSSIPLVHLSSRVQRCRHIKLRIASACRSTFRLQR